MKHRAASRRGVLLLIVLSLLVLFVLIGITFVVVATQYTDAAKAYSRHELKGDDPSKELDAAAYLLLRGSRDPADLLFRHSLLRDLYGVDGFRGQIRRVFPEGSGEFLRIEFDVVTPPVTPKSDDYYNGSVLTLVDGQGRAHSTRIVRFWPNGRPQPNGQPAGTPQLVVAAFEDLASRQVNGNYSAFIPLPRSQFVVNGKPFNGTGDGYDPGTGKLNLKFTNYLTEVALMPNLRGIVPNNNGDSDESWDAVDYQNFFLARIPSSPNMQGTPLNADDPLIPSFHRPFLINYWIHYWQDSGVAKWDTHDLDDFRRQIIARPLPQDHPFFTGSNPWLTAALQSDGRLRPDMDDDTIPDIYDSDKDGDGNLDDEDNNFMVDMSLIYGPWDVDNDADGTPDSIWVDLGLPAKTAPDGRLYKPLFAILCIDLDGRLNVNAHGVKEFQLAGLPLEDPKLLGSQILATAAREPSGPPPTTLTPTRGQGYGPAEIRLETALGEPTMLKLLTRRYDELDVQSGGPGYPGYRGEYSRGVDWLSYLQQWSVPRDYASQFNNNPRGSLYLTPPDLRGVGGVYLDAAGQGQFAAMGIVGETEDDPYELNLLTLQASDTPFGAEELEQLLRINDPDSMSLVPPGNSLRSILVPNPNPAQLNRSKLFTTHSFDIPSANVVVPNKSLRTMKLQANDPRPMLSANATVGDMVRARLQKNGMSDAVLLSRQVALMVPREIRDGRRMDINRWLGNGRDDTLTSNTGLIDVVDEPSDMPADQPQLFWNDPSSPLAAQGRLTVDDPHYNSQTPAIDNRSNPWFSRQQYARHLYCLAMLLLDSQNGGDGQAFTLQSTDGNVNRSKLTARRIAQWAINTVDFRDPDAIMTPFEFDVEPFDEDGWSVDDNFTTTNDGDDRAVVWGCESPELLLTETAATHDRRVQDTNDDNSLDIDQEEVKDRFPQENQDQDPQNDKQPDKDLDQYRIPQGSLFVELYCTRNRQLQTNGIVPNELYSQHPNNGQIVLDLGRVVGGSPVWRIAIADTNLVDKSQIAIKLPALAPDVNPGAFDPNDIGQLARMSAGEGTDGLPDIDLQGKQGELDRFIVFSNALPAGIPLDVRHRYYYNRSAAPLLRPGEYAVIGPRPHTRFGSKRGVNPEDPLPNVPDTQLIELQNNFVQHFDFNGQPRAVQNVPLVPPDRPGEVRVQVVGLVCAADPPTFWPAQDRDRQSWWGRWGIGVNISEPVPGDNYYPAPDRSFAVAMNNPPVYTTKPPSYYVQTGTYVASDLTKVGVPDVPLDDATTAPLGRDDHLRSTGTHEKFRVALLQRLADPTRGYDAVTNPYITVDSQAIDLTVFNGEEDSDGDPEPAGWDRGKWGPYDPDDDFQAAQGNPEEHFEARERGRIGQRPLLWNPESRTPQQTQPLAAATDEYWKHTLNHTLGYLNSTYGMRQAAPLQYLGAPESRFPWLTWNNRPYVSPAELMLVPSSPPWRLCYEFRQDRNIDQRDDDFRVPFTHLLNFFHSSKNAGDGANLCRLFDLLEVPSPFVGTQRWLNSQVFSELMGKNPPIGVADDLWSFNVPNNRLSQFRDPGRVNINTITDQRVWNAIDPDPHQAASWNNVQRSLIAGSDSDRGKRPAFYVNPFRSAAIADLMPLADLEQAPVEATLLRSGSSDRPLFDFQTGPSYATPQNNAYFRYHRLQRLQNLLTTHSNVYAVWITVGYFEALPWNPANPMDLTKAPWVDAAHPDGYQLGLEMGSDTGQIKRHRAFYLIDRSIPVAFEPGENHNVDRAILLRRMIE